MRAQGFDSSKHCVDAIIERVGNRLMVGTPLAAGKANHLLNELYRRAKADPAIQLTILTALTLQRPQPKSDLEARFLGPMVERVFADYPELDYEVDRVAQQLPDNVRVIEFYMAPAKFKDNAQAQRDYISSNYTHAARDILDRRPNVLVQQVAERKGGHSSTLSLSCNADLSMDIITELRRREQSGEKIAIAVQVNNNLPFMFGDAEVEPEVADFIVRNQDEEYQIFGPPKMPVSEVDHAIGLHVSTLVRDEGEIQIGIGALGDAIVHALLLRHERNDAYRQAVGAFDIERRFGAVLDRIGDLKRFDDGLFAASEMLVDGFLDLFDRDIIKRRVYDDVAIQRLLNTGKIFEEVTLSMLDALHEVGAIQSPLSERCVRYLQRFGILRSELRFENGQLILADGRLLEASLSDAAARETLTEHALGQRLSGAAVMHGGFFLGNPRFYQRLRDMPEERRRLINMRSVTKINQLYGHEDLDRLHRKNARFINTCMLVTMSGAACSDALEDGTVISGVGGQYNFVEMAQALPDGHSILCLRATRTAHGEVKSNIVWNYGHITVPRHMRDIYVSEYGIAFVRGKTDEEIIVALLNIADSRFQAELLAQAVQAGKVAAEYTIPERFCNNTPERLMQRMASLDELFPRFPLGCDFTDQELTLGKALKSLKAKLEHPHELLSLAVDSLTTEVHDDAIEPLLERMNLSHPQNAKERLYRRLLAAELRLSGAGSSS